MKNPNSSDGIAEDMIRAFVQFGCSELHAKTLLEKTNAELENGMIDAKKGVELASNYEEMMDSYAELRRGTMKRLFDMYDGDNATWCLVKHLGMGMYTTFEAYQASEHDEKLYELYLEANKQFIKALSMFLGTEITDCSACFADMLKGE